MNILTEAMTEAVLADLKTQPQCVFEKSLVNCHAKGLHSIVIDPNNQYGGMNRVFVALEDHELWRNRPVWDKEFDHSYHQHLSIGVHPHHCGIGITVLAGVVGNMIFKTTTGRGRGYNKFKYRTAIGAEEMSSFRYVGFENLVLLERRFLTAAGRSDDNMTAQEMHTVYVPPGETAAWLIIERQEWEDYQPFCYSNHDLEHFDSSELYKPLTQDVFDRCVAVLEGK